MPLNQGSLVPRINQQDMGKKALPLLYLWTYLHLISNTILLPLLVATFIFSKRAKRHPTLINVCMTWILSGIYSNLLFYAGVSKPTDPEPSRALCVTQTTLMYGITPMWSVAIFVLMWHLVKVASGNTKQEIGRGRMILMLGSPYIVEFSFSLATLVISLTQNPKRIDRKHTFFYCAVHAHHLFDAMAIFTFIMCLGINALEVQLARLLYRNWRGLKEAGRPYHVEFQLLLRVFAFGVYIFFGMVVNVLKMFDSHNLAPEVYVATVGTVIVLVFGTQSDVLRVWCFWRKDPPPPPPKPIVPPNTYQRPILDVDSQSISTLGLGSPPARTVPNVPSPSATRSMDRMWIHREKNPYQRM